MMMSSRSQTPPPPSKPTLDFWKIWRHRFHSQRSKIKLLTPQNCYVTVMLQCPGVCCLMKHSLFSFILKYVIKFSNMLGRKLNFHCPRGPVRPSVRCHASSRKCAMYFLCLAVRQLTSSDLPTDVFPSRVTLNRQSKRNANEITTWGTWHIKINT
jgi:hypothetical protein